MLNIKYMAQVHNYFDVLMGTALVTKCVISYYQSNAVFAIHFTSCTLLTRRNTSVLKVGVSCGLQKL